MTACLPTPEEATMLAAMEALIESGEPHGGGRTYEEHEVMRACEAKGWATYYDGWHITDAGVAALARAKEAGIVG